MGGSIWGFPQPGAKRIRYIMNSQAIWGDYDVVPALSIYELVRPKNLPYVTVVRYHWNGQLRSLIVDLADGAEFSEVAATQTA